MLLTVWNEAAEWRYSYDGLGRPASEQVSIQGAGSRTLTYGYDAYHRPSTVTYPDDEVLTTTYNSRGRGTAAGG